MHHRSVGHKQASSPSIDDPNGQNICLDDLISLGHRPGVNPNPRPASQNYPQGLPTRQGHHPASTAPLVYAPAQRAPHARGSVPCPACHIDPQLAPANSYSYPPHPGSCQLCGAYLMSASSTAGSTRAISASIARGQNASSMNAIRNRVLGPQTQEFLSGVQEAQKVQGGTLSPSQMDAQFLIESGMKAQEQGPVGRYSERKT